MPMSFSLTQMILTRIIMMINSRFFTSGCRALIHRSPNMETLEARIVNSIASHALVHANVKLCQPGTLPRSEGKAKRVIDNRKL